MDTQKTSPEEPTAQPIAESADLPPVVASPPSTVGTLKKKWLLPLLVALGVLVVAGAGTAAYFSFVVAKQPRYILARAIGNTLSSKELTSSQYEGEFTITDQKEHKTYAGTFTGSADSRDMALAASLGVDGATLKLAVRVINDDSAYLKVDGLKGLSDILTASGDKTLSQSAPFIEALNGQWVSFDQNALKSLGADASAETFSLSDKDAQKVERIYKKHFFFAVAKTYPDQKIHGVNSYHYQVKIDRDKLYAFAKELKAADIDGIVVTDEMLAQVKKADTGKYPFEIWVDRDKQIINQVSGTFARDDAKVTLRSALHDINKPVEVTKPQGAKTLLEVLGDSLADEMDVLGSTDAETSVELRPLYN